MPDCMAPVQIESENENAFRINETNFPIGANTRGMHTPERRFHRGATRYTPKARMSAALFTSFSMRDLTIDNRIVVSPMCQYSAREGHATDWHVMHLGQMAQSGAGLVLLEATAVTSEGRISPECLGLWSDAHAESLGEVLRAVRAWSPGAKFGVQLAHAGRKGSTLAPWKGHGQVPTGQGGWQSVAPSTLPFRASDVAPRELSELDIADLIQSFVDAAMRADRIGLDAIELHAAHGYLMHQFLSPLSNQRTDAWGGSLTNRMRLVLDVFDAVRAVWPSGKPLGVRVSATDWVDGGWDLPQTIELAAALQKRGCDWLDVSTGGLDPRQKIEVEPGYQVPFAEAVKQATGMTTMSVGMITDPEQANEIIASGKADMVALARAFLANPRWPWFAAAVLGEQVAVPPQYERGVDGSIVRRTPRN